MRRRTAKIETSQSHRHAPTCSKPKLPWLFTAPEFIFLRSWKVHFRGRKKRRRKTQRKSKLVRDICVQIDLFEWQQKVIVRFKHFIWLYRSAVTTCWITASHHDEVFCCSAVSLWSVSKVRPVNRAQLTSYMNGERCWVCTCLHTVVGMLLLWCLMGWW